MGSFGQAILHGTFHGCEIFCRERNAKKRVKKWQRGQKVKRKPKKANGKTKTKRAAACCEHWAAVQTPVTVIIYFALLGFNLSFYFHHFLSFHSVPFLFFSSFVRIYATFPSNFVGRFPSPSISLQCVHAFVCVVVFFLFLGAFAFDKLLAIYEACVIDEPRCFLCHSRCVRVPLRIHTIFDVWVWMNEWVSFVLFVFLFIVI